MVKLTKNIKEALSKVDVEKHQAKCSVDVGF